MNKIYLPKGIYICNYILTLLIIFKIFKIEKETDISLLFLKKLNENINSFK